jgi:hypothetical protein
MSEYVPLPITNRNKEASFGPGLSALVAGAVDFVSLAAVRRRRPASRRPPRIVVAAGRALRRRVSNCPAAVSEMGGSVYADKAHIGTFPRTQI